MESLYQKTKDNIDHRRNKRTTIANKKSDRVPLKRMRMKMILKRTKNKMIIIDFTVFS